MVVVLVVVVFVRVVDAELNFKLVPELKLEPISCDVLGSRIETPES